MAQAASAGGTQPTPLGGDVAPPRPTDMEMLHEGIKNPGDPGYGAKDFLKNLVPGLQPLQAAQNLLKIGNRGYKKDVADIQAEGQQGRLSPTATSVLQYPSNVMEAATRIGGETATPANAALGVASLHPALRIPIAAYGAITGGKSAIEGLKDLQPGVNKGEGSYAGGGLNPLNWNMNPDALEKTLLGTSAVAGSVALGASGKAPTLTNLRNPGGPPPPSVEAKPQHIDTAASLIESPGGKFDSHEVATKVTTDLRNEAARTNLNPDRFTGREGAKLGLKVVDDTIASKEAEVNALTKPALQDTIHGNPVAKAMRAEITDELRTNEPLVAENIEKEAAKMDRPMSVEDLDNYRKRVNKEQNSFYRKAPGAQIGSEVETQAQVAGLKAARKLQYEYVGNKAGVDPAAIQKMQDTEANLITTRNSIDKQYNTASKAQADVDAQSSRSVKEQLFGVQGKVPSVGSVKSGLVKSATGAVTKKLGLSVGPIESLNNKFKTIFKDLGPHQPSVQPPAPAPSAVQAAPAGAPQSKLPFGPSPLYDIRQTGVPPPAQGSLPLTSGLPKLPPAQAELPLSGAAPSSPARVSSAAKATAEGGGGHTGADISSEELKRGTNFIVPETGVPTWHGAKYAPQETPSGGSHITVFKAARELKPGEYSLGGDSKFRVNEGPTLKPTQVLKVKSMVDEINKGKALPEVSVQRPDGSTLRIKREYLEEAVRKGYKLTK